MTRDINPNALKMQKFDPYKKKFNDMQLIKIIGPHIICKWNYEQGQHDELWQVYPQQTAEHCQEGGCVYIQNELRPYWEKLSHE